MSFLLRAGLLCLACSILSNTAIADSKISGFASFVAGVVTDGDAFIADYPNTGVYDTDISFAPESVIGLQFKTDVSDSGSFIIQAVGRQSDGSAEIDWAYYKYQHDSELSVDVGRKHLPLYYYSDVFDVAYSYHWVRPPSDNYTWQVLNYNGVSLNYEPTLGEWDSLFSFYIGREDSTENRLLTYLANGQPVDETWKNILGVVAEVSDDFIEVRFSVMVSELDRQISGIQTAENVDQQFTGLSVNFDFKNWFILTEYNHYQRNSDDIDVTTYMVSLAYRVGAFKPHITYSELKQDPITGGSDEYHYTTSIGLRWDIASKLALKFQFDHTVDEGVNTTILGNGDLFTVALDMVF